jgi:peptidoglycan/xylan/chitin deacetylase (PgdA/CDA1 family)
MIDLYGRDGPSLLGLQAMLGIEGIPYRRIARLEENSGYPLVVVAQDLTAPEVARLESATALVLCGGEIFATRVFEARAPRLDHAPCMISLDEPVWPESVLEIARTHGKAALRIPMAPFCHAPDLARGTLLAVLSAPRSVGAIAPRPAILRRNRCTWCVVDLGAAFTNLLTETYLPGRQVTAQAPSAGTLPRKLAEAAYYAAPAAVRRRVQARWYGALEDRLDGAREWASEYPIDASGWLLIELLKSLIRIAAGSLVRIARWPAPYHAAATLTHDIEPRRWAYTRGLAHLLDAVTTTGHPATLGLVATPSARYLDDEMVVRLEGRAVICHGLDHRGENVWGRTRVVTSLRTARTRLEQRLGRPVTGYRSPRLDRSPDLAWALDHAGFRYDSSYPDVDRENVAHFGAGVRVNVPYRPIIDDEREGLRPSRCLELPLTAPDCIQPLFAGASVETLRRTVESKAEFLRSTAGLYVALVHGGVFGERDAALRTAHLDFVHRQLHRADVWLASAEEIADWWCSREQLRLSIRHNSVHVTNAGPQPIAGARVIVERDTGDVTLPVPRLLAGAQIILAVPHARAVPAA